MVQSVGTGWFESFKGYECVSLTEADLYIIQEVVNIWSMANCFLSTVVLTVSFCWLGFRIPGLDVCKDRGDPEWEGLRWGCFGTAEAPRDLQAASWEDESPSTYRWDYPHPGTGKLQLLSMALECCLLPFEASDWVSRYFSFFLLFPGTWLDMFFNWLKWVCWCKIFLFCLEMRALLQN